MAGPLKLDNYEIRANESNDEFVITHVPTGKTTTISEDTFESIGAEELSANSINDNGLWFDPADGQSAFESLLSNASDGDVIHITAGTLLTTDPPMEVRKRVHLKGWGRPTLKLDNGFDDSTAEDVIKFRNGASGSTIEGFEVDGNRGGQTVSDFGNNNPGAHGIYFGHAGGGGEYADKMTVRDCYIHDTIRSGIVGYTRDSVVKNVKIENAAHDHWIYLADWQGCKIEDVRCGGYARGTGIQIGSNAVADNIIENLRINNVEVNSYDDPLLSLVHFGGASGSENNTLRGGRFDTSDYGGGANRVRIENDNATIEDIKWRARDSGQPLIEVVGSSQGGTIRDANLLISNSIDDQPTTGVQIRADDVTVDNVTVSESGVPINIRAFTVDGADDVSIVNSVADVDFRALNFANTVNRFWGQNIDNKRSASVSIGPDASVAENGYAEESANAEEPQGNYRDGTVVDFVDSGDGSGTGRYVITRANGAVLL